MKTQCGAKRQFDGRGVNRRSLLAGGAALTAGTLMAPRIARAQPAERVRRIGWLSGTAGVRSTLNEALRELGWVEGRNISFETRNTERPARTVACIGERTRRGQGRYLRRRGADGDPRGHAGHE